MNEAIGLALIFLGILCGARHLTRRKLFSVEKGLRWIERTCGEESRERLGRQIERAGLPKESESRFRAQQIVLAGTGTLFGIALSTMGLPLFLPVTFGVLGFLWPRMRLAQLIRKRQRSILLNLPYYLDLTTLALEAGLDLVAAMDEILRHDRGNPLRDEIAITLGSIGMGATRSDAFARLAERTGLRPLSLLSSAVTQSDELGTSLGHLFRLQSESLRRELGQQAEEEAQRAPIKLLLPMIGLIFPVVFLLLFAPLLLRFLS